MTTAHKPLAAARDAVPRPSSMDRLFAVFLKPLDPVVAAILRLRLGRVQLGWWIMWSLINAVTIWRGYYAVMREAPGLYHGLTDYQGAGPLRYCLFMLVVLFASDGLDGTATHRWGLVTDFGKIVDPIADKLLTGSTLISMWLAMWQLSPWLAVTMAAMVATVLANELWIAGITMVETVRRCRPAADSFGKQKLAMLGLFSLFWLAGAWSLAAGSFDAALGLTIVNIPVWLLTVRLGLLSRRGHQSNLRAGPR